MKIESKKIESKKIERRIIFLQNTLKFSLGAALFLAANLASATDYTIDPSHSAVTFKIRHLAISSVAGSFGTFEGNISFNPDKVDESKAEASIKAESIDTANKKRDDHLRSADFFEVAKFPELKFVSQKVVPISKERFQVKGDLTLHGVTKPVTLDVTYNGKAKDFENNERVAFSANTTVNRKDFGLTWNKVIEAGAVVVGDEVKIDLEIEAVAKKA